MSYRSDRLRQRITMWIVWHLPREIILWAVIRAFAHATTGQWGSSHVDQIGYKEVYDRWLIQ